MTSAGKCSAFTKLWEKKGARNLTEVSHLIDLTNVISQDFLDGNVALALRVKVERSLTRPSEDTMSRCAL